MMIELCVLGVCFAIGLGGVGLLFFLVKGEG